MLINSFSPSFSLSFLIHLIQYTIYTINILYHFTLHLGTSLPSPQPGPSNTPLSSTAMLSSSSATSPVVSPSSNGNILFGTIASSCQYKPNISASLEPHRTELNSSVEESNTPQSAHLLVQNVFIDNFIIFNVILVLFYYTYILMNHLFFLITEELVMY